MPNCANCYAVCAGFIGLEFVFLLEFLVGFLAWIARCSAHGVQSLIRNAGGSSKMSTQLGYDSAAWDLDRIREDAWTKLELADCSTTTPRVMSMYASSGESSVIRRSLSSSITASQVRRSKLDAADSWDATLPRSSSNSAFSCKMPLMILGFGFAWSWFMPPSVCFFHMFNLRIPGIQVSSGLRTAPQTTCKIKQGQSNLLDDWLHVQPKLQLKLARLKNIKTSWRIAKRSCPASVHGSGKSSLKTRQDACNTPRRLEGKTSRKSHNLMRQNDCLLDQLHQNSSDLSCFLIPRFRQSTQEVAKEHHGQTRPKKQGRQTQEDCCSHWKIGLDVKGLHVP